MIEITDITARSFSADRIIVTWVIQDTHEEVHDYHINIYRSNSEGGPWTKIASNLEDRYRYEDVNVATRHKWRIWYYKLELVHKVSGKTEQYEPVSITRRGDLIVEEIQRREEMYFRKFVGRKVLLYPQRTFGQRCTCYDSTLQSHLRGRCLTCFNTGYAGGYQNPIVVYMQIDPTGKTTAMSQDGEMQTENATGRMIAIPEVKPRDIIIEKENRRWRVITSVPTERLREPVHQELQLKGLMQGDIAFKIPIDTTIFQEEDEYRYKRPATI